jgi:hypothetical protein
MERKLKNVDIRNSHGRILNMGRNTGQRGRRETHTVGLDYGENT